MKKCSNCPTYKKGDYCRRCAERAMLRVVEYDAVLDSPLNDPRKIEKLEAVRKRIIINHDMDNEAVTR